MTVDLKKLVDELSKLSVVAAAELSKMLEEAWGVSAAAAAVAVAAPGAAGGAAPEAAEKTEFKIELTEIGAQKLNVIKVVRELTGLGLGEAKAAVEAAPKILKDDANKETAEEWKKKIEEAGAKVTLK